MERSEELYRHLTDLYRRAEQRNVPVFSAFLSPAEQEDFRRDPPKGGIRFSFEGGFPDAERRILVCGSEEDLGFRPEPPVRFVRFSPVSEKYSEELTHRDYLGAILSLGIERNLVGDLLIRENRAAVVCLEQAVPLLISLKEVRRTRVTGEECGPDLPEFTPVFPRNKRQYRLGAPGHSGGRLLRSFPESRRTALSRGKSADKRPSGDRPRQKDQRGQRDLCPRLREIHL